MTELAKKRCIPCEKNGKPLALEVAEGMMKEINEEWMLILEGHLLTREFHFRDFREAMRFANKIAVIAEDEGHHPDLTIGWGVVGVELSTHAIGGLSENDFILASKIDELQS